MRVRLRVCVCVCVARLLLSLPRSLPATGAAIAGGPRPRGSATTERAAAATAQGIVPLPPGGGGAGPAGGCCLSCSTRGLKPASLPPSPPARAARRRGGASDGSLPRGAPRLAAPPPKGLEPWPGGRGQAAGGAFEAGRSSGDLSSVRAWGAVLAAAPSGSAPRGSTRIRGAPASHRSGDTPGRQRQSSWAAQPERPCRPLPLEAPQAAPAPPPPSTAPSVDLPRRPPPACRGPGRLPPHKASRPPSLRLDLEAPCGLAAASGRSRGCFP